MVDTLAALAERAGEVVTKDELLDRVWPGEDVNESNAAQSVYTLRKVLRAHGLGSAIATVPRRGYRLTTPVELIAEAPRAPLPVRPLRVGPPAAAAPSRWLTAAFVLTLAVLGAVPAERALPRPPAAAHRAAVALSPRGAELYRLGRYYWNLRTPAGLAKSARLFAAVTTSDPRSALGYTGQADAELMIADYAHDDAKGSPRLARAAAKIRTALALDADSAPAHASLAMLRFVQHDLRGSEAEFRRAIALDPSYPVAHHWYGTTLMERGRLADASRELRTAIALDPVSAATGAWLAEASYFSRRYADAIAYARLALDLDPHRGGALRRLGLAYELAGDVPHAIAAFERMRGGAEASDAPALLAEAYARAGRVNDARKALREAVRLHADQVDIAFALLALGERARGLAILRARPASKMKSEMPEIRDPRLQPFLSALYPSPRTGSQG